MTLLFGIRLALAAGRHGIARLALMTVGVTVGVTLLLLSLTVLPAVHSREQRQAWHDTSGRSAATAPDAAWWLAVHDHYAGWPLFRVHVAALGPRPLVPPGLTSLPGPGEVAVSPALRDLLRATPDDQLDRRLPGRVTATIGEEGLAYPGELVAVVGHTTQQMQGLAGAQTVTGIQTAEGRSGSDGPLPALVVLGGIGLLTPVVIFIAMVTRVAAARREQRLAALRLAGATRLQIAVIAAAETGLAALAGTILGLLGYLVGRRIVAGQVTYQGHLFIAADVAVPTAQMIAASIAVPLLAMVTTVVALRRVQLSPLGISRSARRPAPTAWRLAPLGIGVAGFAATAVLRHDELITASGDAVKALTAVSLVVTLLGLVYAGPWLCLTVARILAGSSRQVTTLLAARRIATDPHTTFRAVAGVMLAIFTATMFSHLTGATRRDAAEPEPFALRPGVVEVYARGLPAVQLAALTSDQTVVSHPGANGAVAIRCADLARAVYAACPPSRRIGDNAPPGLTGITGVVEPTGTDAGDARVQAVYLITEGTPAAEERARTAAAVTVPGATITTSRDRAVREAIQVSEADNVIRLAALFILLVAACSLSVAVVTGLIERRLPFALLRACGLRVGELRRIVLLESAAPMTATVLGSFGLGLAVSYAISLAGTGAWTPPSWQLYATVGVGLIASIAITTVTLPLMNAATSHNAVRFE